MRVLLLLLLLTGCATRQPDETVLMQKAVLEAKTMLNLHENLHRKHLRTYMRIDPVRYEWCAAFINAVLERNNIPGSGSVHRNPLLARGFLSWGQEVDTPIKGDIVVLKRSDQGWTGHVAFFYDKTLINGKEYYILLGGNQGDKVSLEAFPIKDVISIRRLDNNTLNLSKLANTI